MKKLLFCFALTFCVASIIAQTKVNKYKNVDDIVSKLGALNNFNVAIIADTITEKFTNNEEKARAIYFWIAKNIAIDAKAVKQNDTKNTLPENVIALRKANPLGFSLLYQEMCSNVKIRCLSVDGFVKNYPTEINEKEDEKNYSWNVVQLGQSPESWYFVDVCRASGFLDKKMTTFTPQFTSEYFFADRKLFNLTFFPDNMAWQLGGGVKSLKDYYALPVISNEAFGLEMKSPTPLTGLIKTTLKKPVSFSFTVNNEVPIKNISFYMGDEKKLPKPEAMNFDNNNGTITFSYLFKKADSFPLRIVADGKDILQYMVEVSE